jgi:hypothetical protein
MKYLVSYQKGFVALMSAIIVSVVLLLITTAGSFINFYGRLNVADASYKEESAALARACVGQVQLELGRDGVVTAGTVAIGSDQCTIKTAASPYQVQAQVNGAYTNLEFTLDPDTLAVTSLKEIPTL